MPARASFDVVIAGASIAGCTAARPFALAGAQVALIERRPDPAAYKVACTHQIQSSAAPTIERLGLAPSLEQAGAVRSRAAAWTPYGVGCGFRLPAPPGYGTPPMDDPPPGVRMRIAVERVAGVGPWAD